MNFGLGVLAAAVLLILPGAVVGRAGGLRWLPALAVGPALTYGVVGLTIVPLDALGIRWNAISAVGALAVTAALLAAGRVLLARHATPAESARTPATSQVDGPALTAAAGVVFGAAAIGYAAWRGMPNWQSIPSNWDAVWHANTVRWILAALPGARDTLIGNANVDGSAWMYAVAGLHPLWTHYDYPVQQGPGRNRFLFWAYADDADHDPRIAEVVRALNIKYVLISSPVVRGFVMPDGLVSLDRSTSWAKIYDNGGARIYEWRGSAGSRNEA